jgi:hypothetical protein
MDIRRPLPAPSGLFETYAVQGALRWFACSCAIVVVLLVVRPVTATSQADIPAIYGEAGKLGAIACSGCR